MEEPIELIVSMGEEVEREVMYSGVMPPWTKEAAARAKGDLTPARRGEGSPTNDRDEDPAGVEGKAAASDDGRGKE